MYEVYCNCKKEFSYHLHLAVSDCTIEQDFTSPNKGCCSSTAKCSSNENEDKPCSEKDIKLLKLEAAKTTAESINDIDNLLIALTNFIFLEDYTHFTFESCVKANAPPDSYILRSVFEKNTLPFVQSFLC